MHHQVLFCHGPARLKLAAEAFRPAADGERFAAMGEGA